MTDSDDDNALTRPISVAELLAKNGTIGAPPVGGRRRRRRGNSDAVTVAELTGEIPIISDDTVTTGRPPTRPRSEPVAPEPVAELAQEPDEPVEEVVPNVEPEAKAEADIEAEPEIEPESDTDAEPDSGADPEPMPAPSAAEADYAAHLEQRRVDHDPIEFTPPSRRTQASKSTTFPKTFSSAPPVLPTGTGTGAEQMSPDPVTDDDDEMLDLGPDVDFGEVLDKHSADEHADEAAEDAATQTTTGDEPPSYLRSTSGTLFGGQSVADDLARRGVQPDAEGMEFEHADADPLEKDREKDREKAGESAGGSAFVRGAWVVAQCVLAVAFGAGLFIAFDQLWRWNTIVALVLSVLVILGLVVGVRVVRKTEDIGSTLIAVAVGALVTLGPLALLQSH